MDFIIYVFLFFFLLEILLILKVKWLKKDFQWLITKEDDLHEIDQTALDKFIKYGYDAELGWERKANTSKKEPVKTVGEDKARYSSSYSIKSYKPRDNPGHENLPSCISSFGDSFAFSRHVNDNQTWQWYLSALSRTNVTNYGVGNYGIDQAFLRFKREFPRRKTRIVIMMVAPETISRIVNIWKHYSEYGNTFGFKGRYVIENDALRWIKNPIDEKDKYKTISIYKEWIQKHDYCYQNKFSNDMLRFPYSWHMTRNFKKSYPLIKALIIRKIYKLSGLYNEKVINQPWEIILERNFEFTVSLFKDRQIKELLFRIVMEFKKNVEEEGSIPVFVFVPYLHDIRYMEDHECYYSDFIKQVGSCLLTVDMAETFLKLKGPEDIYVSRYYGAHLNDKGNRIMAEHLFGVLKKISLVPNDE